MPERKYKVVGPHTVLGHDPETEFVYVLTPGDEAYYFNTGHLAAAGKAAKEPELLCEACQAHGNAEQKKTGYKNIVALREHYGKEHPALSAPTG